MHYVAVLFIIPALVTAYEQCYRGPAKSYIHTYNRGEELEIPHQRALEEIRQAFANTKGVKQIDNPFTRIATELTPDSFVLELRELEVTLPDQKRVTVKEFIGYDTKQFKKAWVTYIVNEARSESLPKIVLAQNGRFKSVEDYCVPLFSPNGRLYQ